MVNYPLKSSNIYTIWAIPESVQNFIILSLKYFLQQQHNNNYNNNNNRELWQMRETRYDSCVILETWVTHKLCFFFFCAKKITFHFFVFKARAAVRRVVYFWAIIFALNTPSPAPPPTPHNSRQQHQGFSCKQIERYFLNFVFVFLLFVGMPHSATNIFLDFQMNQNWVQKLIPAWLWHHFYLVYWVKIWTQNLMIVSRIDRTDPLNFVFVCNRRY